MAESNLQKAPELLDLAQLDAPQAVSMWPQTLAWQILFALVLVCVALYLWHRFQTYRKALWKRQALTLAVEANCSQQAGHWFALIKRVMMVQQGRASVSAMSDEQVLAHFSGFDDTCKDALLTAHYRPDSRLSDEINQAVYHSFRQRLAQLPNVIVTPETKDQQEASHV